MFEVDPENEAMIRNLFEKAANTVVEASHLRQEVQELKKELEAIRETLREVASDRNKAWSRIDQLQSDLNDLREENRVLREQRDAAHRDIETLTKHLQASQDEVLARSREIDELKDAAGMRESVIKRQAEQIESLRLRLDDRNGRLREIRRVLDANTVAASETVQGQEVPAASEVEAA